MERYGKAVKVINTSDKGLMSFLETLHRLHAT